MRKDYFNENVFEVNKVSTKYQVKLLSYPDAVEVSQFLREKLTDNSIDQTRVEGYFANSSPITYHFGFYEYGILFALLELDLDNKRMRARINDLLVLRAFEGFGVDKEIVSEFEEYLNGLNYRLVNY